MLCLSDIIVKQFCFTNFQKRKQISTLAHNFFSKSSLSNPVNPDFSKHLQPNDNVPLLQRINEMQSEYPLSDMDSPISGRYY